MALLFGRRRMAAAAAGSGMRCVPAAAAAAAAVLLLLVACVRVGVYSSSADAPVYVNVRGVAPDELERFHTYTYVCDGGARSVHISAVNDDYCDCADGSDEPGTSACGTGSFYCENKGHRAERLATMYVDDGICDCCDGSDEREMPCANTCEAQGHEATRNLNELIGNAKRGLAVRQTIGADVAAAFAKKQAELNALVAEIAELQAKIDGAADTIAAAAEAEAALQAAADAVKAERKATKNSGGGDGGGGLDADFYGDDDEAEEDSEEADGEFEFWDDEVDFPELYAQSQGTHDDDGSGGGWGVGVARRVRAVADAATDWTGRALALLSSALSMLGGGGGGGGRRRGFRDYEPSEPSESAVVKKLKSDEKADKKTMSRLSKDRKALAALLTDTYFGDDNVFFSLLDECFTINDKYEYTLCPFKDVRQKDGGSTTDLGKWGKWSDDHRTMHYTGGKKCWGGPDRSTVVTLVCGEANAVLFVDEPATCEYVMDFATPLACTEQLLASLEAQAAERASGARMPRYLELIESEHTEKPHARHVHDEL